jgi:hypothetical protein
MTVPVQEAESLWILARLSPAPDVFESVRSTRSRPSEMRRKEDSLKTIMWSKHSCRSEPIKRSA